MGEVFALEVVTSAADLVFPEFVDELVSMLEATTMVVNPTEQVRQGEANLLTEQAGPSSSQVLNFALQLISMSLRRKSRVLHSLLSLRFQKIIFWIISMPS